MTPTRSERSWRTEGWRPVEIRVDATKAERVVRLLQKVGPLADNSARGPRSLVFFEALRLLSAYGLTFTSTYPLVQQHWLS